MNSYVFIVPNSSNYSFMLFTMKSFHLPLLLLYKPVVKAFMESYSTTWIDGHEISSILRQVSSCIVFQQSHTMLEFLFFTEAWKRI